MAYFKPRILNIQGRTLTIAHAEVPSQPYTVLIENIAVAGTTLTVLDNAGFSNSAPTNILLIGDLGNKQTEIKNVNGAVSAGTSITSTAVTFAHSTGVSVRSILFNQWRIYGTTTTTFATTNLIATIDMQVNAPYTTYTNTGTEYTYYWVVAYDSINTVTGNNSDYISASSGYPSNSIGSLIASALDGAKTKISSGQAGIITTDWCIREINDCLRFITGKLKRWSYLQSFNYVLGQAVRGSFNFTLPADIEDVNSIKSILDVRVGSNEGLFYRDKKEWERETRGLIFTTVSSQAVATDTSLNITNSYDFADSGSVNVYVSATKYTLTYTGVTRSATAGVLTGIPASGTGSITVTIAAATNVFQNELEGLPKWFTVYDNSLYIYPIPDAQEDNQNVFLDYFTTRTLVDSASDTIEGSRYDAVKHWLIWKLRGQSNATGKLDLTDGDFILFKEILGDLVRREVSGQKHKMKPRVNIIDYGAKPPPQNA